MVTTSKPNVSRKIVKKTRVRISKSGQITLPAGTRKRLGVEVGDHVDFVEEHDGTVKIKPVHLLSVDEIAGKFGRPVDPGEMREALHDARKSGAVRQRYQDGRIIDDID